MTGDFAEALRGPSPTRWSIMVINGPNMNVLGRRDKGVYGLIKSLEDLNNAVTEFGRQIGVDVDHFQSNHEGELLDRIHSSASSVDGYLVNPAGLTTSGLGLRDALADSGRPFVDTHFANLSRYFEKISPRVPLDSLFAHSAEAGVTGFRAYSYHAALLGLTLSLDDPEFLGKDARKAGGVDG